MNGSFHSCCSLRVINYFDYYSCLAAFVFLSLLLLSLLLFAFMIKSRLFSSIQLIELVQVASRPASQVGQTNWPPIFAARSNCTSGRQPGEPSTSKHTKGAKLANRAV